MRRFDHYMKFSVLMIAVVAVVSACHQSSQTKSSHDKVDSLFDAVMRVRNYDRLLTLADSLESAEAVSAIEANFRRGYAYHKKKQYGSAELYYHMVQTATPKNTDEKHTWLLNAGYFADMLYIKHDYEGALRISVPVVHEMEEKGDVYSDAMILLLSSIGRCQMKLGRMKDASATFMKDYQYNLQNIETDTTGVALKNALIHTGNVIIRYLNARMIPDALPWIDRTEALLNQYADHPSANPSFIEEYRARLNIYRAYVLEKKDQHEAAAEAYQAFMTSDYAKSDDGRVDACEYLIAARRYQEAADNLKDIDRMMDKWGYKLSLDNIQGYLLPKYVSNVGAGRRDSANAVAAQICGALDSALVWQKNDDAAELAAIYDTQQKEMKIAQQEKDLAVQKLMTMAIVLGLTIVFFIIYALYRMNTIRRLAEKNAQLKIANTRAEESSKMKTNFIQQISHEFRTPLNILNGFTQILTAPDMELQKEEKADIQQRISESAERITSLVNTMLELSEANSQQVIERNDDVLALMIANQAASNASILQDTLFKFDIHADAQAEAVTLHTNQQSATRALTLLLDNARKFTKEGEVRLMIQKQAEIIDFIVEDTGIGIPAQEAEHIFEEFVQLDSYYDGTGIGLTVARSIARRLGGDIVLDTSYTGGARFIMTLPV